MSFLFSVPCLLITRIRVRARVRVRDFFPFLSPGYSLGRFQRPAASASFALAFSTVTVIVMVDTPSLTASGHVTDVSSSD